MVNKNISMSKVRHIMKLHAQGMGKKRIAQRLCISKNTVRLYITLLQRLQLSLQELQKLSDHDLNQLLHPPEKVLAEGRLKQLFDFFPEVDKQMRRRGMTVAQQYEQYRLHHPDGYRSTTFYKYYDQWKKQVYPSMHIEHKVGDKVYVDYAGDTLPYVDPDTGELKEAQVFVAILGWSQYAYVEAMRSQTVEEFIAACENAFHFFRGIPLALVPDNLKSAVFKASKYEPELNENFKAFADHYGIAILPARVRHPKDKAHVENMVKLAYQRIYARLPEGAVLPLEELNRAVTEHLAVFNKSPLSGKRCSRYDQWLAELPTLHELAAHRYEMRRIKQVTVMKNGHVYLTEDQHYYSVPYELIGKKLRLQYSRSVVELFENYTLVAVHKRLRSAHQYTTVPEHMPPQHHYVTQWNPAFFLDKARAIDPVVEYYIGQVLARKAHPEQAYKSCQGILSFGKRVGNARLINACRRAHEIGYYNYKTIEDILKKQLDKYEEDPVATAMPSHANIRGGNYYQ